jgi:hypothetical protein
MGGAAAAFARNRDCLEIPPMQCDRRRRAMIFKASASKIFQHSSAASERRESRCAFASQARDEHHI